MLRAILSNRLSSNNEAKENRTIHKTPSKKALNKTIGNNKTGKKINKLQAYNSDLNALNVISDDKELLKQSNLKTPLKITQQRAPLSNIKKTNVKEKSVKNINNQLRKTTHSVKKKSSSQLVATPSSLKIHKIQNENENESTNLHSLRRQNSLNHLSPSTPTLPNTLKKSRSFDINSYQKAGQKENIFITHMKKNTLENKNEIVDDIEYMPPSLAHLEEEIEPKYKINFEDLLKFKPVTVVDSDIFKRVNEEIDIDLDPEANALKTKNFEFVDDFVIDFDSSSKKIKDETLYSENKDTKNEDSQKMNKKEKDKAIQEKLFQDFNLSFEEASDDEEIKLPDFLTTDDKDSLYFDEINL